MSASKRADVIANAQKVLAKHFKPSKPVERPVMEQLLYACCLEDSRPEAADECFARLQESFFDWNEIRVTTVRELAEVLRGLHDADRAATMIKHTLHSVFEAIYDFDLEPLKKQNLGAAVKQLQGYRGTTPFTINYTVQAVLGGHAIPVSRTGMEIMRILGLVTEKGVDQGLVPGLERAIPKNKGVEFASLLQQFAAEYAAAPFNPEVRAILTEIDPQAKDRLPKRGARKTTAPEPEEVKRPAVKKKDGKHSAKEAAKPAAKKKVAHKKPPTNAAKAKKTPGNSKSRKPIAKKASPTAKKSTSKQLARRKPR
jgi:endonuclease-3